MDEDPASCKRWISALVFFRRHFRLSLLNKFYCDILHLYNIQLNIVIATRFFFLQLTQSQLEPSAHLNVSARKLGRFWPRFSRLIRMRWTGQSPFWLVNRITNQKNRTLYQNWLQTNFSFPFSEQFFSPFSYLLILENIVSDGLGKCIALRFSPSCNYILWSLSFLWFSDKFERRKSSSPNHQASFQRTNQFNKRSSRRD